MEQLKFAAAYVRVSTDDQIEYSPESQIKAIRDAAARDRYIVPEEYVFTDEAISGKRADKRPAFMLLIAKAKEPDPGFDRIYVWEYSRFARNQEESIVYKNLLRKRGITVQSIKEPFSDSPFSSLIERIIEWMDEYYLINLATEVRRGMAEKASRGEALSTAPFGYRIDSVNKTYAIVPEDAEVIRWVYDQFQSGTGSRRLAVMLNERGVKTKRGNPIDSRWVHYVLKNPVYTGKIRWSTEGRANYDRSNYNGENVALIDGKHKAIIRQEQFDAVQRRIAEYSEPKKALDPNHEYMLHGLLVCSSCGANLVRSSKDSLQCSRYVRGKCKESHHISVQKADAAVTEFLENVSLGDEFIASRLNAPKPESLSKSWDSLIAAEEKKISRAREAYLNGTFTEEEFREARSSAESNRQKFLKAMDAEQRRDAIKRRTSPSTLRKKIISTLKIIKSKNASEEKKNAALREIVDKIIFDRKETTFDVFFKG